jgi:hypothetical protein
MVAMHLFKSILLKIWIRDHFIEDEVLILRSQPYLHEVLAAGEEASGEPHKLPATLL